MNKRQYSQQSYQRELGGTLIGEESIELNFQGLKSTDVNEIIFNNWECVPLVGKNIEGDDIQGLINENFLNSWNSLNLNNTPFKKPHQLIQCNYNVLPPEKITNIDLGFNFCISPFIYEELPIVDTLNKCITCSAYPHQLSRLDDESTFWSCAMCGNSNQIPLENRERFITSFKIIQENDNVEYLISPKTQRLPYDHHLFIILLDISYPALINGSLSSALFILQENLIKIKGNHRVLFITVSDQVHFYHFRDYNSKPIQLTLATILDEDLNDELFLPLPITELSVDIKSNWNSIELFLSSLEASLHNSIPVFETLSPLVLNLLAKDESINVATILWFQTLMPTKGPGALNNKGGIAMLGSKNEYKLLQETNLFYKNLSVDFSEKGITIDAFIFGNTEWDLQSLYPLIKVTGGYLHFYPDYKSNSTLDDTIHFDRLYYHLSKRLLNLSAFAATLRINLPDGISGECFYGNGFMKSTTSLNLGTLSKYSTSGFKFMINERLYTIKDDIKGRNNKTAFQAVVTYLDCEGNILSRVMNYSVATLTLFNIEHQLANINLTVYFWFLIIKHLDQLNIQPIETTRELLFSDLVQYFVNYFNAIKVSHSHLDTLIVSQNSYMFPYLINAALKLKSVMLGSTISPNSRILEVNQISNITPNELINKILPPLYKLPDSANSKPMIRLNPSSLHLTINSIILLECYEILYIWIGKNVSPEQLLYWFNVQAINQIPKGIQNNLELHTLPILQSFLLQHYKNQLPNIIYLVYDTADRDNFNQLYTEFINSFPEDKNLNGTSYQLFLVDILENIKKRIKIN